MKRWIVFTLLILVCACALPPAGLTPSAPTLIPSKPNQLIPSGTVQNDLFQFEITSGWKVKNGPLASGKNAWNYYNLNLEILVQVYQDQYNAVLTVARREMPKGSSLGQEFTQTYTAIANQIRNDQTSEGNMDGRKALVRSYERPWGEPWLRFRDVWIEKEGWIYVISLKSSLKPVSAELELVEKVYTTFHLR